MARDIMDTREQNPDLPGDVIPDVRGAPITSGVVLRLLGVGAADLADADERTVSSPVQTPPLQEYTHE